MTWFHDFISLVYPRICVCCGNSLWRHEQVVCNACRFRLPQTFFHLEDDNPVNRVFYGRVRLERAAAFLLFNKGGKVQRMIHHLKYKGRKDVGIWLGEEYGRTLRKTSYAEDIDLIIPVPLHKKKYMQRGYNQSEQFAIGLSRVLKIPVANKVLARNRATSTQTRKGRYERWKNVEGLFTLTAPELAEGRRILLVDDVITTGATLEACVTALTSAPGVKVSVVAIAAAKL